MRKLIPSVRRAAFVSVMLFCGVSALPVMAQNFVPARNPDSAQGAFLKGRLALLNYDLEQAATSYKSAFALDPQNAELHEQAYLGALITGDMAFLNANPMTDTDATGATKAARRQTTAVWALSQGNKAEALKQINELLTLREADRTGLLLSPWILAMNGKWDEALTVPAAAHRERLVSLFLKLEHAQLLEMRGRSAEAEALYKELCAPGAPLVFFGPDYAAFLERAGRRQEAMAIYQDLMKVNDDPSVKLAHARALDPKSTPPRLLSLKEGAAEALFLAATVYGGEQDNEFALIDLRQYLFLNTSPVRKPEEGDKTDRALILTGQMLYKMRDARAAEGIWDRIHAGSPYYAEAQSRLAWSLKGRGELSASEAIFNALSERDPSNSDYVMERAYILTGRDDNAGALKLIEAYRARPDAQPLDAQGHYFLAILYDLNKDWPKAEVEAKKSLELKPESSETLNFLGYGWIDRNMNLKAGLEMVLKAQSLAPKSGAIMDSVGWAYYRLKDYEQARSWLEKAFQFEPSNPEIYEHMGDVYLALARTREARFEWERVKTLEPDEGQRARVQAKIDQLPAGGGKPAIVGVQASR